MNILQAITQEQLRKDIPSFRPGDTLKVHVKVIEGTRERIQLFEGVVIKRRGGGIGETFTVRKISYGVGVERTFPVNSLNSRKSKWLAVVKCVVRSCIIFVTCAVKLQELKKFVARIVTKERGLNSSPFRLFLVIKEFWIPAKYLSKHEVKASLCGVFRHMCLRNSFSEKAS